MFSLFSFLLVENQDVEVKREDNGENEMSLLCSNVGALNLSESVRDHRVFSNAMPVSSTPMKAASGPLIDGNVGIEAQPSVDRGFGTALEALNSIVFGAQAPFNGSSNLWFYGNSSYFGQIGSNPQLPSGFGASASAISFNSFIPGGISAIDSNISTGVLSNANNGFNTANNGILGDATISAGVEMENPDGDAMNDVKPAKSKVLKEEN